MLATHTPASTNEIVSRNKLGVDAVLLSNSGLLHPSHAQIFT